MQQKVSVTLSQLKQFVRRRILFTVNAYAAAPSVRSLLRRTFSGSFTGGIQEAQEVLDFCAEHQIAADIEVINADQIYEAFERVMPSDVRHRLLIDAATIDALVCSTTTDTTGPVT